MRIQTDFIDLAVKAMHLCCHFAHLRSLPETVHADDDLWWLNNLVGFVSKMSASAQSSRFSEGKLGVLLDSVCVKGKVDKLSVLRLQAP